MSLLSLIVGVFSGIAICMGTFYSVAQVIFGGGWSRLFHILAIAAMGGVMWFLLVRDFATARSLAPILLFTCTLTFLTERGLYKTLPLIQGIFAFLVIVHFDE